MRTSRKNGSLVIEFIAILPVFFFLAWGCLQIMFYTNANSVLHQAATDAARVVAIELRGHIGPITAIADSKTKEIIEEQVRNKVYNVTKYNALILLYRNRDYSYKGINDVTVHLDSGSCQEKLKGDKVSAICVETITDNTNVNALKFNSKQEQIVVRIKAPFKLIGGYLPSLFTLSAKGQGSAIKEISERWNYIEGSKVVD